MSEQFLKIDIDENSFAIKVREKIRTSASGLHEILLQALKLELQKSVSNSFKNEQLVNVKASDKCDPAAHSIQEAIDIGGYPFFQIQVQIDLNSGIHIKESDIKEFECIEIPPIKYWKSTARISLKHKSMKTRERFLVKLFHIVIPTNTLRKIHENFDSQCECAHDQLRPVKHSVWHWLQQFGCIYCGKRYVCKCFKKAADKHIKSDPDQANSKILPEFKYRSGICHLCTGRPSNLFFCHPMYASPVRVKYGAYMRKYEIQEDISERDAENKVREILEIPKIGEKWVNETLLFKLVEFLFFSHEVIREASPDWLGNQRLDIYIPDLALAIEYQGKQHYQPVSLFGGEKGLKKTRERDRTKLKLCKQNGVKIMYFSYKEELTQSRVEKSIIRELNSNQRTRI